MAKLKETSMAGIFKNKVDLYGDKACVSYKKNGVYTDLSWNEMNEKIRNLAAYLLDLGVKRGDKIGLFSPNRYEWFVADMAMGSIGAVNVPIYSTNSAEEAQYILENSESKYCFVADQEYLAKVQKVKKKLPKMKQIIVFDKPSKKGKDVVTLEDAIKKGEGSKKHSQIDKAINANKPDGLQTIIYTSGTTGNPKGVMLSFNNFVSNIRNAHKAVGGILNENDVALSFLPLSHSLERMAGYYLTLDNGVKIAYAEDVSTLLEDMKDVRPTVIISVPRIYEKVHAGILAKVADAPGIKKAIFNFAMSMARKNLPYFCNNKPRSGLFDRLYNLADKLVFSGLKENIGLDKLRFAVSGGGPLSVSDAEFFLGMEIKILEGFGLSETTPVTNVNLPDKIKPGTVGPAIPQTKVKISDEGEILIKGPQVMLGYYKNPKATKEVFTKDGWFKTGDIGVIDEDGFLSITGRIKDIIVTAGGKNISPQNLENDMKTSTYIEQVAVIGDKRKYLSALVIPAFEATHKWAKKQGITASTNQELIENEQVKELIGSEIEKLTKHYARVEQIRQFTLLDAEWTQETDELTPTQKIKRRVVEAKYAKEIEAMYPAE